MTGGRHDSGQELQGGDVTPLVFVGRERAAAGFSYEASKHRQTMLECVGWFLSMNSHLASVSVGFEVAKFTSYLALLNKEDIIQQNFLSMR